MADAATAPADATTTPPAAPAAPTPSLEDRVAALTRELDQERSQRKMLEDTFRALGGGGAATQPARATSAAPGVGFGAPPSESLQRLKAALGPQWSDDDLRSHWNIIAAFLGELGAPVFQALGTLADHTDRFDALLGVDGYKELADEVEQERKARAARGEFLSRRELHQLVRARKLPELIEQAATAKLEEQRQREAAAAAATTQEGAVSAGVQKPGPAPTKQPRTLTPEALAALPRGERAKAIEQQLGDTPL